MQLRYNQNIVVKPIAIKPIQSPIKRSLSPAKTRTIQILHQPRVRSAVSKKPLITFRPTTPRPPIRPVRHTLLATKQRTARVLIAKPPSQEPSNTAAFQIHNRGIGKILIIVGNGPSHKEAALPKLKNISNIDIMSINKPDERLWPTNYWLFVDNSQVRRHQSLLTGYKGTLINSSAIRSVKSNIRIKSLHGNGFSLNLHKGMYIGKSSVYAAIQVGIWMGY